MPFNSEGVSTEGVALALSGGGYRAVLFHCGAFLRLNEMAILSRVARISSVSGGSIAAGRLALKWPDLAMDAQGRFDGSLLDQVIGPLRRFCGQALDVAATLRGALNPFKTAGDELIQAYRSKLKFGVPLKDLIAKGPRFVFNATNYATGTSFRFSAPYCGDYRIGLIYKHDFDLATAVACSSAFPPVFAPIELDVDPSKFEHTLGADLFADEAFRRRLSLADGGIYDNMGLETVWGRYTTVLVSDGGKPFELNPEPGGGLKQLSRVADIGLNQALALRKRFLIDAFQAGKKAGTYWGIGTLVDDYGLGLESLEVAPAMTAKLRSMRTRLNSFSEQEQEELINWGYAVCDAAIRSHASELVEAGTSSAKFPFPGRKMS